MAAVVLQSKSIALHCTYLCILENRFLSNHRKIISFAYIGVVCRVFAQSIYTLRISFNSVLRYVVEIFGSFKDLATTKSWVIIRHTRMSMNAINHIST